MKFLAALVVLVALTRAAEKVGAEAFAVGDTVEGNFKNAGKWWPATVVSVNENGTYTVDWADGDTNARTLQEDEIRAKDGAKAKDGETRDGHSGHGDMKFGKDWKDLDKKDKEEFLKERTKDFEDFELTEAEIKEYKECAETVMGEWKDAKEMEDHDKKPIAERAEDMQEICGGNAARITFRILKGAAKKMGKAAKDEAKSHWEGTDMKEKRDKLPEDVREKFFNDAGEFTGDFSKIAEKIVWKKESEWADPEVPEVAPAEEQEDEEIMALVEADMIDGMTAAALNSISDADADEQAATKGEAATPEAEESPAAMFAFGFATLVLSLL